MEHWDDQAIILSARPHGEGGAVVCALTRARGRHAGYVYAGTSSARNRALLQPGALVGLVWDARTNDQLGTFKVEEGQGLPLDWLDDAAALCALQSVCILLERTLPERSPYAALYEGTAAWLQNLGAARDIWGATLVLWELSLLRELGFGLDLSKCVATGAHDNLTYVSPKSGGAVCESAAAAYKDRLLALPPFVKGEPVLNDGDVAAGLKLSAHFLEHRAFAHTSYDLPEPRRRLMSFFAC